MKKKITIFSFFTLFALCSVLFLACDQNNEIDKKTETSLIIKNQSSVVLKRFVYDGESLEYIGEGGRIPVSGRGKIPLETGSSGYLVFSIVDNANDRMIRVRTHEVLTVSKGETRTFLVTDNTSVVPLDEATSLVFTIFTLLHPARLKLVNQTATKISDISFGGKEHKETVISGNLWEVSFNGEVSGKLSFKLWDANNNATQVVLRDEITIKNDEKREVILENHSLVIKEGKVEAIKTLLGLSVITVINDSSAEISNLKLGEQRKENALPKNESWDAGAFDSIDEFLTFDVKIKTKQLNVKCIEKLSCNKGETKSFRIADNIQVEVGSKTLKLGDVLNASVINVSNELDIDLYEVKFAGIDVGILSKRGKKELFIIDFSNVPDHINFAFSLPCTSNIIKARTEEKVFIDRKQEETFIIDRNTAVIKSGSNEKVKIKRLLGISTLEVVNLTTAKSIKELKFGGISWDKELKGSEAWEVDFDGGIESILTFTIVSGAASFESKTTDKIVVPKGSLVRFELTNNKQVITQPGPTSVRLTIQAILDIACLSIYNGSSVDLLNVAFATHKWGNILKDYEGHYLYYRPPVNGPVSFQVKTSKGLVKLLTPLILNKGEGIDIRVNDDSLFYRADIDRWVSISSLLDNE